MQWGFQTSRSDTSLFLKHTSSDILVILIYVDDILVAGLSDFNYFLGLNKAHMLDSKGCNTPISVADKLYKDKGKLFENHFLYRSVIGSLQYVTLIRPDISFTVNKLSQFLAALTVLHLQACKRVLRLSSVYNYLWDSIL